jgi:hypothetical protein
VTCICRPVGYATNHAHRLLRGATGFKVFAYFLFVFIYVRFYIFRSNSDRGLNDRMVVNKELKRLCKETAVNKFEVISRYLHECTE